MNIIQLVLIGVIVFLIVIIINRLRITRLEKLIRRNSFLLKQCKELSEYLTTQEKYREKLILECKGLVSESRLLIDRNMIDDAHLILDKAESIYINISKSLDFSEQTRSNIDKLLLQVKTK